MNNRKHDKLNGRKLKSMGGLGALGFMMLFQYQNCAPPPHSVKASNDDGIVSTIDDVNLTTGVSFTQTKVRVASSPQPISVDGICQSQQDGAVLGWKVHDSAGHLRETGYAECAGGKFVVEMSPSNELDCDKSYMLSAQLSSGNVGVVDVRRECNNQASSD